MATAEDKEKNPEANEQSIIFYKESGLDIDITHFHIIRKLA